MQLRWGETADAPALAEVFFRSVREGESPYSEAQRAAWMAAPPDLDRFTQKLASYDVAIACENECPVGFIASDLSGYVDLAFILPHARGQGVFRNLYVMIENRMRARGVAHLRTHASLTAQPAFAAMGFSVIQHETVERDGVELPRAEMEKHLT